MNRADFSSSGIGAREIVDAAFINPNEALANDPLLI